MSYKPRPFLPPFLALWGWPIAMGVLTTTGLITALVSDTWGDWWSWLGLGVPVVVMCWFAWRRPAATDLTTSPAAAAESAMGRPTFSSLAKPAETTEPEASARATSIQKP